MEIQTRTFGPVEIEESQLVTFTDPLPGFPKRTRFAVLNPDPETPFSFLQSVEEADVCLLIADPRHFFPDYRVELRAGALADLEIEDGSQTAVAVVLNVPADPADATANLLAPIVFNADRKLARQVILEGSGYPVREPLFCEEKRAVHGL